MEAQKSKQKSKKQPFEKPKVALSDFIKEFDKASHYHNPSKVFDDFLKITICTLSRDMSNPVKSLYESEYMELIQPYIKTKTFDNLVRMFGILLGNSERFYQSSVGNDLLGEFYQREISRGKNGEYFTPSTICGFMAQIVGIEGGEKRILDNACGSGRMLLAAKLEEFKNNPNPFTKHNNYYGIDLNVLCVRMTAINMLLNGLDGEVIQANALNPEDFRGGYKIIAYPSPNLGIHKIEEQENSQIWQSHQRQLEELRKGKEIERQNLIVTLPSEEQKKEESKPTGQQLNLF